MGKIIVVGVGSRRGELTEGAMALLRSGAAVILHTRRCYCAEWLDYNGIFYESLDELYEKCDDFDEHAALAAQRVAAAAQTRDVAYCVMDMRDKSARLLAEYGARVEPGAHIEGALWALADGATFAFAASECAEVCLDSNFAALVREIDSRELACDVKLKLMEAYPDDHIIHVHTGDGIAEIPLYKLDRLTAYDHKTAALANPVKDIAHKSAFSLRELIALARDQRDYYKEIDYDELLKALLTVAGGAAYAEDRGEYAISDVLYDICDKILNANA